MPELTADFQSLPEDYQHLIRLAQDTYRITVAPLQLLVGGWSGAVVYLVSVSSNETRRVEHCILKLDRKGKNAKSDEVTRHNTVMNKSAPEFARDHIAELVFDHVEYEGVIGIFYRIAGQSLLKYRPLSNYERQSQLKNIFEKTNIILLDEWNANQTFEQAVHPQKVLEKWLSFRLHAGGNIERFLQNNCRVNPDITGFLISGHVFPNPLLYTRKPEPWGKVRAIDVATGFIHGDLNTNNILVKFSDDNESLAGYYLIDFALFKESMPLLYDQRYLEMSYLMHAMLQISFAKCVNFITLMAVADIPDHHKVPIETSGMSAVIASARTAFAAWVQGNHPSLHDDLWGQYWLAGVAAGLTYCHKAGLSDEQRLAGLIYAAANLRRYAATFNLPLPTNVELLYDENQSDAYSSGTSKAKKSKLPAQPTPFIGRTAQIAALKELLLRSDVRLVTLIGSGGTGKTRLSLRVAEEMLDQFPQGVFFIPLADDNDANQFISRVAQHLEVREGGRSLLDNVKDYLYDKRLLLVLDNFEQLISAAPVVADLLIVASQLKILISSRILLNLHGERSLPVPPLELPQTENELSVENLIGNESVTLFVERAQAVQPNFALTHDNASAVAEICHRLDGLPLALELAAARVKLLQPGAILTRLDDKLKLLTGGARDLPTRHQTLRNTLEWSYDLLNQDEKILYARLSVFVGGFTLEAAEAVCNQDGRLDILESLTSLVNNSLIRQDETVDGEPRFGMLETIRAYALERLADRGEMDVLRAQHAGYFASLIANHVLLELYSAKAIYWLDWLEREHDNVRATLNWYLADRDSAELLATLVFALTWFWYRRGYFSEGRRWAERALASPALTTASPAHALALVSNGLLAIWQGEQQIGLAHLQESLTIWQRLEDKQWLAPTFLANGIALINMGRDGAALPFLEKARAMLEGANQPFFHVFTLVHLGNAELGLGNPDQARAWLEKALAEAGAIGDSWLLSFALNNLGEVARTLGQYDRARTYYEQSESLLRSIDDKGDLARLIHTLGYIAQYEEDFELAESQFRKSLTMFRRLGNRRGIAECLAGLAGLKARQGQIEWGTIMLSAAESVLNITGGAWWPADRVEVERNREMMQSALSESELTTAQKKGKAMTLEQALSFASE